MRLKLRDGDGAVTAVELARRQTALESFDVVALLEEDVSTLRAPVGDAARSYDDRVAVT